MPTKPETIKIGLIGLGVMGQNLALNIERSGYPIAVFDREQPVLEKYLQQVAGKQITGARSAEEFVHSLERPRKIVLLVKAGEATDWTIDLIKPHLDKGDIVIDCGNSYFKDTESREQQLRAEGLYLIGSGTSGGEKGALLGPSLMPGGDPSAYEQIRPIWEAIAAKVADGPCVTYIGPGGAGHFVKMVHN
ncbi:MAG: NAD(P)-binding domain-containing protein, partial [Pyrinomonadaceae bacterium]